MEVGGISVARIGSGALYRGDLFMAGNETTPRPEDDSTVNHVLPALSPEETASFAKALAELAAMDVSEMVKRPKGSVVTEADGSMTLKLPSGDEIKGLGPEAFWGGSFMPSCEMEEIIPPTSDNGEDAMGLLDKFRICLCSEVTGVITLNGTPVAGTEVIRRLDLFLPKDQVYTDSTVTDGDGRFSFAPRYARRLKPLMAEVRTDQKLLVRHEGKQYLGWANGRSGLELHEDVDCFGSGQPDFYIRLKFNGDLARATPLPEEADLDRLMKKDSFFNSQVVCIGTRLRFFVTMNGEKAVGAKVVRTAEHVGYGNYEQSKLSDCDGEVDMPGLYAAELEHPWAKTEIKQKVVITYEGKEYLAWEKTKTNPWEEGEYNIDNEKPLLHAEITAELTEDQNVMRGVKTDPERCWKGEQGADYLPDDALPYRGLFQVIRHDSGYEKRK